MGDIERKVVRWWGCKSTGLAAGVSPVVTFEARVGSSAIDARQMIHLHIGLFDEVGFIEDGRCRHLRMEGEDQEDAWPCGKCPRHEKGDIGSAFLGFPHVLEARMYIFTYR